MVLPRENLREYLVELTCDPLYVGVDVTAQEHYKSNRHLLAPGILSIEVLRDPADRSKQAQKQISEQLEVSSAIPSLIEIVDQSATRSLPASTGPRSVLSLRITSRCNVSLSRSGPTLRFRNQRGPTLASTESCLRNDWRIRHEYGMDSSTKRIRSRSASLYVLRQARFDRYHADRAISDCSKKLHRASIK